MIRWLDALGPLKWPSLLLIGAPLVAYPFWSPGPTPAERCGRVVVDAQAFDVFRSLGAGEAVLRPAQRAEGSTPAIDIGEPLRFEPGGMVADGENWVKSGSIVPAAAEGFCFEAASVRSWSRATVSSRSASGRSRNVCFSPSKPMKQTFSRSVLSGTTRAMTDDTIFAERASILPMAFFVSAASFTPEQSLGC